MLFDRVDSNMKALAAERIDSTMKSLTVGKD